MLRKAAMFFSRLEIADNYSFDFAKSRFIMLRLAFVSSGLLLCLGLAGFVLLWPDRRKFLIPALFFAVYAASVVAFHVASRYRFPVLPLLGATGGVFLAGFPGALAARRVKTAAASCLILALTAFAVYRPYSFVPDNIEKTFDVPYNALGTGAAKKGDYQAALAWYGRALEINPANAVVLYNRADSLRVLGRTGEAEADLRRAVIWHGIRGPPAGTNQVRNTSVCSSISRLHPPVARSSIRSSISRSKPEPFSADPCTSTSFPEAVQATFMSTPARQSSA